MVRCVMKHFKWLLVFTLLTGFLLLVLSGSRDGRSSFEWLSSLRVVDESPAQQPFDTCELPFPFGTVGEDSTCANESGSLLAVQFRGSLGNHLFQYASALALATRLHKTLIK